MSSRVGGPVLIVSPHPLVMGQPTMPNGVPSNSNNNALPGSNNGHHKKARSGYNAKAMAEIRNSLRPFEQPDQRPVSSLSTASSLNSAYSDSIQCLVNMGYDEELSNVALVHGGGRMETALDFLHRQYSAEISNMDVINGLGSTSQRGLGANVRVVRKSSLESRAESPALPNSAPALPPRTHKDRPVRMGDVPPPLPPPRTSAPPLPPPRGSTPPPTIPPYSSSLSSSSSTLGMSSQQQQPPPPPPPILRRMSPVSSQVPSRGLSPVSLRVSTSRDIGLVGNSLDSIKNLSLFPGGDGNGEPPPPYPMGTGTLTPNPPPPSYSQSLAMRGSPTLSSTSSTDYRRSPAYPSPASSMMSSRSSSLQAWSSRATKTHSPIIMQSVKSTQVQKPVLQTATAPKEVVVSSDSSTLPPPSYEFSMQQKTQQQQQQSLSSPTPKRPLPPPPPYPSTALSAHFENGDSPLVNSSHPMKDVVLGSGKVISSHVNGLRSPLLRKLSPLNNPIYPNTPNYLNTNNSNNLNSSSSGSICPSRSESPDSPPLLNYLEEEPMKTTHHTSPKPERKSISGEKDQVRKEESLIRNCPPQAFKFFMEQHIENVMKESKQRKARQMRLEKELAQLNVNDPLMSEQMRAVLRRKETNYLRMKRAKLNKRHFKKIKAIGVGAFGEVSLVRNIHQSSSSKTGGLYAMKTLKKSHVVDRNQVAHVIAEKDILAEADNDWIVKLYYSFQDKDNLYFVMEYIPGGDLMSLLIKLGIFEESMARFYVAELTCAVDSVHKMGFIHRDIKPDNILIDSKGHIKLTDFGLCTGFRWTHNSKYYQHNADGHCRQDSMDPGNLDLDSGRCSCPSTPNVLKPLERRRLKEHQRCMAHSLVGTPNYIAPEVLLRQGYTQLCDWWSVGVILYEMLVGQPPFHANSPAETQYKVINWEHTLHIPRGAKLSEDAKDLIKSLCYIAEHRLGKNGSDEIKRHKFFAGIDFDKPFRSQAAPYRPDIMFETDTSNFDPIDPERLRVSEDDDDHEDEKKDYHGFYEFTFRRFFDDGGHPLRMDDFSSSTSATNSASTPTPTTPPDPVYV